MTAPLSAVVTWDEIEGWAIAGHPDARNGHNIQGIEVKVTWFVVVGLGGRYSTYSGPLSVTSTRRTKVVRVWTRHTSV